MKYEDFLKVLFNGNAPPKPFHYGRPPNVAHNGRVWRRGGVVLKAHYARHVSSGKLIYREVKGVKNPTAINTLHRSIDPAVFKARKESIARKAAGRYVW